MLIKFHSNMSYRGLEFEQGKVYDISDSKDGFIGRCIRRGHEKLEDHDGEVLQDLRFPIVEKVEVKIEEKPEPKEDEVKPVEENEEKPKPKRKTRKKKVIED